MYCDKLIHIGVPDTGEGVVRHALHKYVRAKDADPQIRKVLRFKGETCGAHLKLRDVREKVPNAVPFTFTRNPYDWYVSCWIHQLKMRQAAAPFGEWFSTHHGAFTSTWQAHTNINGFCGIQSKYIGRFEHLENDLVRILASIAPVLTPTCVHSWFPEAYRQWSNRPWIDGIEQWMRSELYSEAMKYTVQTCDGWALARWEYSFDDVYTFTPAPCP